MVKSSDKKLKQGKPAAPVIKDTDSALAKIAAWLRNEKKSGLHTKEAVQYEKVSCRRCGNYVLASCVSQLMISLALRMTISLYICQLSDQTATSAEAGYSAVAQQPGRILRHLRIGDATQPQAAFSRPLHSALSTSKGRSS